MSPLGRRWSSSTKMSNVIDADEMLAHSAHFRKTCYFFLYIIFYLIFIYTTLVSMFIYQIDDLRKPRAGFTKLLIVIYMKEMN